VRREALNGLAVLAAGSLLLAQPAPRVGALVAALRPALPFPSASADGAQPADGSASPRWFVVWPSVDEAMVRVRANPLHPETQRTVASAEVDIQQAVAAAERRAQAAYERALAEVRRTGKSTDVAGISLDDEGVAGERLDAELELTVALEPAARSFDVLSSEPPVVEAGTKGVSWIVRIAPNTFRDASAPDGREHFRAAEAHLVYGDVARPAVVRAGDTPRFTVTVAPSPGAFAVVLRGNESLLAQVLAAADWARLAP
jgi:hypothetical protein